MNSDQAGPSSSDKLDRDAKHVTFFSNHLRGPKGSAGARSWHQAKCLSDNYFVTVIIPGIDPVSSKIVSADSYAGLNESRVDILKIWTTKNNRSSKYSRFIYYLSGVISQLWYGLRIKKCHCVLTMSLPITTLAVAFLISKVKRVPLVVDLRDLPFETAAELGYLSQGLVLKYASALEKYILRKASSVITNSPRYVSFLIKNGVAEDKLTLAYIGYDNFEVSTEEAVSNKRGELLSDLHKSTKKIITYTGTLGHAFPVDQLLDAALILKGRQDIGFVVVGDGQRYEELKTFAEKHSLNVMFMGRLEKRNVHLICNAVDLCFYPCADGEFSACILGNKIFDYFGAHKPIVYSGPDSAVSDIIKEMHAGELCIDGNADDVAAAMLRVLDNPLVYEEYVEGAKAYKSAGLTAEISATKLRDEIDALLN